MKIYSTENSEEPLNYVVGLWIAVRRNVGAGQFQFGR